MRSFKSRLGLFPQEKVQLAVVVRPMITRVVVPAEPDGQTVCLRVSPVRPVHDVMPLQILDRPTDEAPLLGLHDARPHARLPVLVFASNARHSSSVSTAGFGGSSFSPNFFSSSHDPPAVSRCSKLWNVVCFFDLV